MEHQRDSRGRFTHRAVAHATGGALDSDALSIPPEAVAPLSQMIFDHAPVTEHGAVHLARKIVAAAPAKTLIHRIIEGIQKVFGALKPAPSGGGFLDSLVSGLGKFGTVAKAFIRHPVTQYAASDHPHAQTGHYSEPPPESVWPQYYQPPPPPSALPGRHQRAQPRHPPHRPAYEMDNEYEEEEQAPPAKAKKGGACSGCGGPQSGGMCLGGPCRTMAGAIVGGRRKKGGAPIGGGISGGYPVGGGISGGYPVGGYPIGGAIGGKRGAKRGGAIVGGAIVGGRGRKAGGGILSGVLSKFGL